MDTRVINSREDFQQWLEQYRDGQRQYAFRGQADSSWPLRTSLARHFIKNPIAADQWRRRELKMYRMFRERLLVLFPGMYEDWGPLDILSLMQHHGTPTRHLDFTYSPGVAAYFALSEAQSDSAIGVVDCAFLEKRRQKLDLPKYCGPTHIPEYTKLLKKHYKGGAIVKPDRHHGRLLAQRGCFLNTGSISQPISEELIKTKVILSEWIVDECLMHLKGLGVDRHGVFPKLTKLARQVNSFSATGSADFPDTGDRPE
jgi:hypothetical protein